MRRAVLLSPLALLTSACATRPWTPAVSVAYWSETPEARTTELPAQAEALRRWQVPPSDPWAGYAKYTLITSLAEAPTMAELTSLAAPTVSGEKQ